MTTTTTTPTAADTREESPSPVLLLTGVVRAVERLSPAFVRIWLGGEGFEHVGPEGSTLDQRIKLLVPDPGRPVPTAAFESAGSGDWYAAWLALPEAERGHLRTYTARRIDGDGGDRRLVVDFVLHGTDGHRPAGPAATWAASARPGDEIGVLAPRRGLERGFGGIEFAPGAARRLLLVADETAVPALCSILESLPGDAQGVAVAEVPDSGDILEHVAPDGVQVHWIARGERARGRASIALLRAVCDLDAPVGRAASEPAPDGDDEVWETPVFSSSGEPLEPETAPATPEETYAWVAGDSATVKAIRRLLVGEVRMPRHQVAFMGYWKDGAAQG